MIKKWWKEGIVYQLYPRSFQDSNGDGVGDIPGIISRLDYLKELGVTMIWLNPVYQSPNDDMGYDISDYRQISAEFGTMEDMETLIRELHNRDMKLLMDLVVNHTSDEHQWFLESRKSKDNPYRDYYIWKEPVEGKEPNDWQSSFSGSAWEYDETTGQYYLHLFSKKQPDLNWDNPKVREEIYDMMTFWLDKGIDGFRMDVINYIGKNFKTNEHMNQANTHAYLHEMNEKVLSKYDIMTVGETPCVTPESATLFVKEDREELNMLFQFEHMGVDTMADRYVPREFNPKELMDILEKWQMNLGDDCWNSLYLNNHDQTRAVSRFGNDTKYRKESAKMLATMLHMQKGTPYILQGEEIGMTNCVWNSKEEWRDISSINYFTENQEKEEEEALFERINYNSRDNSRTPMQWNDKDNAGFTTGKPWIKVNENYKNINVEEALADKESIFYYYKKLIALRKERPIMVYGSYQPVNTGMENFFAFLREYEGEKWLVLLNYSEEEKNYEFDKHLGFTAGKTIISNYENGTNRFLPYEARVIEVTRKCD